MAAPKLVSVVIPAYNEEDCLPALYERLTAVFAALPQYDYEILLVDNGSRDGTFVTASSLHARDARFKVIRLTRNFLPEGGIAAGMAAAKGDAVVIMSADLEDPPEVIPHLLARWEGGYDNVYGIIEKRTGPWLRRINAALFYRAIHRLTGGLVPRDVADFRLVDRRLCDVINQMPERSRFLRGMFAWPGFRSAGIPFARGRRQGGRSKATTQVVVDLAFRGIFGFSTAPLRLPMMLGILLLVPSALGLLYCVSKLLIFGWLPFSGFGIMLCVNLFLFAVVFIILGLMGEYIGMILSEAKGRPLFVVDTQLGLD